MATRCIPQPLPATVLSDVPPPPPLGVIPREEWGERIRQHAEQNAIHAESLKAEMKAAENPYYAPRQPVVDLRSYVPDRRREPHWVVRAFVEALIIIGMIYGSALIYALSRLGG